MFQNFPYNFNPYCGQYDPGPRQPSQPQIQGIKFVQNFQEATNCTIPLGSKALFMDKNEDIFYLKETDFNGYSTVTRYRFQKYEPIQESAEYITRAEFDRWKEEYEQSLRINDAPQSARHESADAIHQDNIAATSENTSRANAKGGESLFAGV